MKLRIILYLFTALLVLACGEGKVSLDPALYEPKIAFEGYLIPNHPVDNIMVWRNFPVDANIQEVARHPFSAEVSLTDLYTETTYPLTLMTFEGNGIFYEYAGNDLLIAPEKSYRLDVTAAFEGHTLQASATTTVPAPGMTITGINYTSLRYRQRTPDDLLMHFNIEFERSPGTDVYLYTVEALTPSVETFIYDNPFENADEDDVADDLEDYRFSREWLQNTPLTAGRSNLEIYWFDTWFYGDYDVVVYAPDRNYQDFLRTFDDVQDDDGNFHAPVFHLEGEGVGVFGSALVDTIRISVTP